jgi:preprotein translocase subunit SecE
MALSIYKSGQGYWTRLMSAIGAGTLVLAGVGWLWGKFEVWFQNDTVYWQGGMAVLTIGFFGALLFWLLNKPNIADFMIATEAEMKKVHWPTRKEAMQLTIVVIAGTLLIAGLLFVIDVFFGWFFLLINVLDSGAGAV